MLGKLAVAGDLGSFEARDMAKHFPKLLGMMTALNVRGKESVPLLANMLQTQILATGNADAAANNLANLMAKFTSEDSQKKFLSMKGADGKGTNLELSMAKASAQKIDPFHAFFDILQQTIERSQPENAAQIAELREQIKKEEDKAEASALLEKYIEMAGISDLISDQQAKQAALAYMQNKGVHEANLKTIRETDGVAKVEEDLARKRERSKNIWDEAGNAIDRATTRIGEAIRPITDLIGKAVDGFASGIGYVAGAFPVATAGVLGLGAALASWGTLKGAINIARGAFGLLRLGRTAGVDRLASQGVARTGVLGRVGQAMSRIPGVGRLGQAMSRIPGMGRVGQVMSRVPGLNRLAGAANIVSAATATPVFVTNWPGGGLIGSGLPGGGNVPGNLPAPTGKPGLLARAGGAVGTAAAGTGRAALNATGITRLGAAITRLSGLSGLGASVGSAGLASAGGAVAAAGAAGYATGKYIAAPLVDAAVRTVTRSENSLGTWIYEKLHPEDESGQSAPTRDEERKPIEAAVPKTPVASAIPERRPTRDEERKPIEAAAPKAPVASAIPERRPTRDEERKPIEAAVPRAPVASVIPERRPMEELKKAESPKEAATALPQPLTQNKSTAPAAKSAPQQVGMTFSPTLQITVNGDVKEPRKLAEELMPHLKRLFDNFAQKTARGDLFDPAHA
jgi:hypothetical protein